MITITIPDNNINERDYIINILFKEFLGLDYKIIYGSKDYIIELENKNQLIIIDSFFNKFPNNLEYLSFKNIPSNVKFFRNNFIMEEDIPVIFGNNILKVKNKKNILCGIDIFASSFFMLTRWEEYVNKNRDNYNRFPATESLAYKNNFLDRPIINEYVEMLWNMFRYLDIKQNRMVREYELILTHDVDYLYYWKGYKQFLRQIASDIIKKKDILLALKNSKEYVFIKIKKIKDPYDTFDWIMDKSEEIGVKSRFYFMSGGVTQYDNRYNISEEKSLDLIEKIKSRGHIIGIHPSYNAYNNFEQLKKEKDLLASITQEFIEEGREHYLRFEAPTTWQIWEDNGLKIDSTCGYSDKIGFRCGTSDVYSVFNFLTRKQLKLKERPLIVMETSLIGNYTNFITSKDLIDKINYLKNKTIKYHSTFVLLWHNSNLTVEQKINYKNVYEHILKENEI